MTSEIYPGVQLLIKRMESNPEEFLDGFRWSSTIECYKQYFSPAEKAVLEDAQRKMQLTQMEASIMKELLDPAPQQDHWHGQHQPQQYVNTFPVTSSATTLDQIQNYRRMLYLHTT
jgi:hypothetical protein